MWACVLLSLPNILMVTLEHVIQLLKPPAIIFLFLSPQNAAHRLGSSHRDWTVDKPWNQIPYWILDDFVFTRVHSLVFNNEWLLACVPRVEFPAWQVQAQIQIPVSASLNISSRNSYRTWSLREMVAEAILLIRHLSKIDIYAFI